MPEYGFERKSFQSNIVKIVVTILMLAVMFVWTIVITPDHGGFVPIGYRKQLLVDFINVGQGDAVLLRTPRGKNFLIDGGTNTTSTQAKIENRELVQEYLRKVGVSSLDGIVVTHPHNDHLGGIIPVLKRYKTNKVWDCGSSFNTVTYEDYIALCDKKRIPRVAVKAGDILDWGEELFVQVLHPTHISKSLEFSDMNNKSVTLLIRFGKVTMLLTGDIEEKAQKEVARYGNGLAGQIIKAPHHGSETSLHLPFIKSVSPVQAVIQAGRDNPFGHPSDKMLNLYRNMGIKIFRNDQHGNIRLAIGGTDIKDFSFEVDRKF